jgi:mannose-1-phosphate guanylyltransferase / mannose-6-phosphate isomerase
MDNFMKILILTGGSGTRLWPLSTNDTPKQFLKLGNNLSLLQGTIKRFLGLVPASDIFLVTNEKFEQKIQQEIEMFPEMNKTNLILEPEAKNTLPAIALGVAYLEKHNLIKDSDSVFVTPADHNIEPEEVFINYLQQVDNLTKKNKIVTMGITPSYPEIGYGYIESSEQKIENGFIVKQFVEKPNLETAKSYLEAGNFYWNSGMFGFSMKIFYEEVKQFAPEIHQLMLQGYDTLLNQFSTLPKVSIDYGIMEKSSSVIILPINLEWTDVGCFDTIFDVADKDEQENHLQGNVRSFHSKRCLTISTREKPISLVDCEDLIVIDTPEALLIMKKGSSQQVKTVVESWSKQKQASS